MNNEENKAIEKIKRQIVIGECEKNIGIPVYISDLKVALNLIEKQENMYRKEYNEHMEKKRQNGVLINNELILKRELEKKDSEIERYKMMLAETHANFLNSDLETKRKNDEDLEMLNNGWKLELEKKSKIINLMAEHLEKHSTAFTELYGAKAKDWIGYFERKVEK